MARDRHRALVWALVVAAGLVLGWLAVRVSPAAALVLAALPVAVPIAWRQPALGVPAILVAAAAVRAALPTGTMSPIVASLLLSAVALGLWLAFTLLEPGRLPLRPAPANLPLFGFIGAALFSYLWGNLTFDPFVATWPSWPWVQLASLAVMVLLPATFLFTASVVRDERWLKAGVGIMLGVGFLALLPPARQLLTVRPLFPLWFVSLSLGQALFNRRLSRLLRYLLAVGALAWLGLAVAGWTGWFSAWVPLVVGLPAMLLRRHRLFLLGLAVAALISVAANWPRVRQIVQENQSGSGATRVEALAYNWQISRTHLLFGLGPAAYEAYYRTYLPQHQMATHNNYMDLLSETGLLGLGFMLWFLGAVGLQSYRLTRRLAGRGDFAEGYANAALAGWVGVVVAMALGDWVIPFPYTQGIVGYDYAVYNWILLAGIVCLDSLTAGKPGPAGGAGR